MRHAILGFFILGALAAPSAAQQPLDDSILEARIDEWQKKLERVESDIKYAHREVASGKGNIMLVLETLEENQATIKLIKDWVQVQLMAERRPHNKKRLAPLMALFYAADASERSAGRLHENISNLENNWERPPSAPPIPQARPAKINDAARKLDSIRYFAGKHRSTPHQAYIPTQDISNNLDGLREIIALLEREIPQESDQALLAYYQQLLAYAKSLREEQSALLAKRSGHDDEVAGRRSIHGSGESRHDPLVLHIGIAIENHIRSVLPDKERIRERLEDKLRAEHPRYTVTLDVEKGSEQSWKRWVATFAAKQDSTGASPGRIDLAFPAATALAGQVVFHPDLPLSLAGEKFSDTFMPGTMMEQTLYCRFDDKFLVKGRLVVNDKTKLPRESYAWVLGERQCRKENCPKDQDHHKQNVNFFASGASRLATYKEDPDALGDNIFEKFSVGVGPVTISPKGIKVGPKVGLGPFEVGLDTAFELNRFKTPGPDFKTPSGGAVVTIGYSVYSVRDGSILKPEHEAALLFSAAVGLRQGENFVETSKGYEKLLKAGYGAQYGARLGHYLNSYWPEKEFGVLLDQKDVYPHSRPSYGQQVQAVPYESSYDYQRSSVLVNRVSFVAVDVSLALSRSHLKDVREPLTLGFSLWPERQEGHSDPTKPSSAKTYEGVEMDVKPLDLIGADK